MNCLSSVSHRYKLEINQRMDELQRVYHRAAGWRERSSSVIHQTRGRGAEPRVGQGRNANGLGEACRGESSINTHLMDCGGVQLCEGGRECVCGCAFRGKMEARGLEVRR